MKLQKVLLKGFLVFLIAQVVAILGSFLWLKFDNADYGLGGGVVLWLVYIGLSIFITVTGTVLVIILDKANWKKYLLMIPEVVLLQIIMFQVLIVGMTLFFESMDDKLSEETSIMILD